MKLRRHLAGTVAVVAGLAIVGAACGGGGNNTTSTTGGAETSSPGAPAVSALDLSAPSGIRGGDPDFNFSALTWQGYWLSRDHFGPFVMASGLGIPFEPPMEMIQAAMQMVTQNASDPAMVPQNLAPLQAIYASGSSTLVNDPRNFAPLDFQAFRLDPATFNQKVSVRGQAETMLKESQWAHNFADAHFGDPSGDFGGQQRFVGMMVALLSQMQGQYAMQNLLQADGLYHDSDGAVDYAGNWVMLHALSDVAGLTSDRPEMNHGRYLNPDAHAAFEDAATNLLEALRAREPESATEAAAAIRALIYRAWTTDDAGVADAALARAQAIADGRLLTFKSDDVVQNAAAIAGLIAVDAVENDGKYRDAAGVLFRALSDDFDAELGLYKSKSVYNVDDVAWIIGGLNSLVQQGGEPNQGPAGRMLLAFYESTISLGGMQLSAPPGKDGAMAGDWEKDLPSAVYYHPANTPAPPVSGKLPVPAEEITWDGSAWKVTSDRFVPAGAMHLANELNWIGPHLGSIPFPPIGDQGNGQPSGGGAPVTSATVVGKNIAFDIDMLTVAAGQEITVTFDHQDAGVFHNFHVQAGAGGDFKTEIEKGPIQQTLTFTINQPGRYTFICDVHPNQMKGTLAVQ